MSDFPYRMTRCGVVMRPNPADAHQAEGVLNPAAGYTPDGRLLLFPRLVARGNRSRIGVADVEVTDGVPTAASLRGIALAPDRTWEHGTDHGGVEDPRITFIESLGVYVMTYVAYGPLGPRPALAVSHDLASWTRLGPVQFAYEDALDTDLNLFPNKDLVWFPEVVPGPDGGPCLGFIHRPMWEIEGQLASLPAGVTDARQAIWISYVDLASAQADLTQLLRPWGHQQLAAAEYDWEALKIGGGPPPVRVPEGWLFLHHGVSGTMTSNPFDAQKNVRYAAGGMILDITDPRRIIARTAEPLLAPETDEERIGMVGNVVFPTAIVDVDGTMFCFYGMADEAIGVARIDRVPAAGRASESKPLTSSPCR